MATSVPDGPRLQQCELVRELEGLHDLTIAWFFSVSLEKASKPILSECNSIRDVAYDGISPSSSRWRLVVLPVFQSVALGPAQQA